MDARKAKRFKETLTEFREHMIDNRRMTRDEKLDMLAKVEDNWYEPVCFQYNLLAPYPTPDYIRSQYESAKRVEEGTLFLYVTLHAGVWITKADLYRNFADMEDD